MRRCSDELDAIRLWCERSMFVKPVNASCFLGFDLGYNVEEKMKRFESVKVENETINDIYGTEIYKIRDNLDEDSPVSNYRALKKSTDELVDWLNENIKEVELKPVDKLEKALKELYEPDEVQLNYCDGLFFIVEIKDTDVTSWNLVKELDIPRTSIMVESMGSNRAIYKIWESCLE